jgi:hypothetical protein
MFPPLPLARAGALSPQCHEIHKGRLRFSFIVDIFYMGLEISIPGQVQVFETEKGIALPVVAVHNCR